VAAGVALLVFCSALFLGDRSVAGSQEPFPQFGDLVVPVVGAPSVQTVDARLAEAGETPGEARPPLMPAGQPAAEPIAALPTPTPAQLAPTVALLQAAPTPTFVPPAPTATPKPPAPPAAAPAVSLDAFEADIVAGVNNERIAAGLAPLQVDGGLVAVARERSNDMIRQGYFAHVSPTGETAFSLLDVYGIPYIWAGENLARNNYPDDQSVAIAMRDWMASQGHRENMLNVHYTAIGVGAAVDGAGVKYFTVVFTGS
jgi:uncharacterized protein YkwD